jgi:hypothetical protein
MNDYTMLLVIFSTMFLKNKADLLRIQVDHLMRIVVVLVLTVAR